MEDPRAKQLAKQMREEGRTQAWLAEKTGFSPTHVSGVLAGNRPMTHQFHAACLMAFGKQPTTGDRFAGRAVRVPLSIYRRDPAVVEHVVEVYEEAWKADWLAEHAETVLAEAAARAFDRHHKIAAAERDWLNSRTAS